ncbi:MAG TPA: efflux RND transporter periplasmic adaptor subunit [Burkholderiaceae bacterium]|nr:efflux RND transporter periplasmic adaptor subunit [Burkholderiaceae bacterium]
MQTTKKDALILSLIAGASLAAALATVALAQDKPASATSTAAPKPALTVTVTTPQAGRWPSVIAANGSIAAWQEAIIGAEAQGLRLTEVRAAVGDRVKRGQVLATLATETLAADAAAVRAGVAEAEAVQAEAAANAERARQLQASGAISAQQIQQYVTAEATARARVTSLRAQLKSAEVRLAQTRITAPDDGIVSARLATVGAVVQPGQELFRLIRKERLEWRAEVAAADLARIAPGQQVTLTPAGGGAVGGTVRMVAPTVDAATRNGMVFVDIAKPGAAKAGMFARGEFAVGEREGLTLPQAALVLRDGFHWVYQVGAGDKVQQLKVGVGARVGDRVEITGGLPKDARVVAQGAGFLADGDVVRVVAGK